MILSAKDYKGEVLTRGKLFELLLTGVTYIPEEGEIQENEGLVLPQTDWFEEVMNNLPPDYDPYFRPGGKHHPVLEKLFSSVRRRFKGQSQDLSLYVSIGTKLDIYNHTDMFFYWCGARLTIDLTTYKLGLTYVPKKNHMALSPEDIGLRTSNFEAYDFLQAADFRDLSFKIKDQIKFVRSNYITRRARYKRSQRIKHERMLRRNNH